MLIEQYINKYGAFQPCHCLRYFVHPLIMVGGNINDAADWEHLQKDFKLASVINVDGISDAGKNIALLSELAVPDNGDPFPKGIVRHAVSFAKLTHSFGGIYVHCHLGISRSPAFAYAIMRWVFEMSKDEALAAIRAGGGFQGEIYAMQPKQAGYIISIEEALKA